MSCQRVKLGAAGGQAASSELNEIPEVAVEVLEHGDCAIGLLGGRADEADTFGSHSVIVAPEIVGAQEQKDAPARLVADEGLLLGRRGAGEEEGGGVLARAGRRDEHPAFHFIEGSILDEGEAELLREPGDRLVIVADDEGDVGERLVHSTARNYNMGATGQF